MSCNAPEEPNVNTTKIYYCLGEGQKKAVYPSTADRRPTWSNTTPTNTHAQRQLRKLQHNNTVLGLKYAFISSTKSPTYFIQYQPAQILELNIP